MKRWLLPFNEFPNLTTAPQTLTNECCFLDEASPLDPLELTSFLSTDYSPYKPFDRWFGLKNLDYSDGGALEVILGYSLSFFRSPYNSRNSLEFMNFVYDFLQLKLKVANVYSRAYLPSTFRPGAGDHSQTPYQFADDSVDFLGFGYSKAGSSNNVGTPQNTLNLAIDSYNASTPQYIPFSNFTSKEDIRSLSQSNGRGIANISHTYNYVKYLAQGFDGNIVDMADLQVLLRTATYNEKDVSDEFFNYMPKGDWPLGDNSISPIVENVNGLDVVRVTSKINGILPYTTIGTADIDYHDNINDNSTIPFLSINIEGFLNYYTEP